MAVGSGVTVVVDAQNKTAQAFGEAAKGAKTVGDAAAIAEKQLRDMDAKLDSANTRARKLAEAEERAAEKARRMAEDLGRLKRQLADTGDESGQLGRKIDRLSTDTRHAAIATEEYRRAANKAAADAREQARAYDRVADNARQAARAVAMLGAESRLGGGGRGGFLGGLSGISEGFLKQGIGGAGAGLEGALGTPVVGPALLAAGAAAAVPAASFVGAAAGGGVLAGAGLAAAGGGLAGAWMGDPDKYGRQWEGMIDRVRKRWIDSSKAFGNELDGALKTAGATLDRLPIEKVLALSQSFVAPISTGAGQGVAGAANGFADALERVQPVIDKIGPKIGNLGQDIGDAFRMISEGSEGGADALGDFIDLVGYTVKAAGVLVLGFEKAYEGMRSFAIGAYKAEAALSPIGNILEQAAGSFLHIGNTSQEVGRTLDDSSSSAHGMASSWGEMARAGAEAAIDASNLNSALTELHETQLAMADANIAVAQGWMDLKEELKDGAKSLDLNTQAGIDNQRAIVGQIGLLEAQRQQAIATSDGSVEAVDKANAAYNAQVEQLRQAAYAAGFNKQQVDALIASLGAVPPDTKANVEVRGLSESLRQGESLRQRLDAIDGREVHANVYVAYHTQGQALNAPLRTGGIPHAAAGGPQGRDTLVGEEGPEIVRLPSGAMVYPRANTNQMMAGGGGGQRTQIDWNITGGGFFYDMIMAGLRSGELQVPESAIVK